MFSSFSKHLAAIWIAGFLLILASCGNSGPRTIEDPWINLSNTSIIDIDKVELTDSATILTVKATFNPHMWIKIVSDTKLTADGKDYAMTRADGIEPDEEFWMPDSGKAEFKLFFEPLPFNTKYFDFIEGDAPGAFRLLDIDITGKKIAEYPDGVPGEFKKKVKDGNVPDPVFEMGKTTINFHIRPFRQEVIPNLSIYVNTMAGQQEYTLTLDDKGDGTVSFDQYGTAYAMVFDPSCGMILGDITLYPGENIDCYLDARISGKRAMSNNREISTEIHSLVHNGKYSDYDRAISKSPNVGGMSLYNGDFDNYHMTGEEYKNKVKGLYIALSDSINRSDMLGIQKEHAMLALQNDVLDAMADYRGILEMGYHRIHGDWRNPVPEDSIQAKLTDDDYKEVAGWFDISNPRLLIRETDMGKINWNAYGVPGDLSKSIGMFRRMIRRIDDGDLSAADLDSLKALSNPFFATASDSLAQRRIREFNELKKHATVAPTPDVADDKVFDAIIAPHKGKVVIVDLWNTWCGPCRMALKEVEPLKSGELNNEDIVWIYIADESSDAVKYLRMLPDIKGIHYKLNSDQIGVLRKRFNVDGIPYYILVDRQGKATGRPDLRDHNSFKQAKKDAL